MSYKRRFIFINVVLISMYVIFSLFPQNLNAARADVYVDHDLNTLIDRAMKNHPQVIAAKNNLDAAKSKVGQSKAAYFPQIKWSAGLSRNSSSAKSSAYNEYTNSLSLNQNVYDFDRTSKQVEIENVNLEAMRANLDDVMQKIALGVKQAYYELLRSKRIREINAETVRQFEKHLETAKGSFEVGLKPKFDVTKAEVDLSNARINSLKAQNAVSIAQSTLNNAIGVPSSSFLDVQDREEYIIPDFSLDLDGLLKGAFANRPDYKSALFKVESAQKSVELSKRDYYPVLSGTAKYGWSGEEYPLESGWNIGANLDFHIFSGLSTKYQVDEAFANFESAKSNAENLRQAIQLDVEQAYFNLQESQKRISVAEIAVRQAQENLDLAQGRYAAGIGNPLEVTDGLVALGNARTSLSGAVYDFKIAGANLAKAVGRSEEAE